MYETPETHRKEWLREAGLTRLRRTILLGVKSILQHGLRSMLTVLGIVFGVCSVISMLAVGEGASFEAQEQIRRLGSDNIIIRSVKPADSEKASGERSMSLEYGITYSDLEQIQNTIPGVTVVAPGRVMRKDVWNASKRVDAEVVGTVPWYPQMRNLQLLSGRFFNEFDLDRNANVGVLEAALVPKLFPRGSPLGKSVRVGNDYYTIIGVVEAASAQAEPDEKKRSKAGANASAPRLYIPLSAAKSRFGEMLVKRSQGSFEAEKVELHEAVVKVARQEDVEETAAIVEEILDRNHKKEDYMLQVPLAELRAARKLAQVFNLVLGSIAAISLIVGGIGIMNIMLASVTERTREIGIRRALGAKRRDIIVQFLIETVLLSGTGGLIGVALGLTIPYFISTFADMRTIVTPASPVIAFTISGLVGVIFGIYPAMRAARMDPVEALRHE